LENRLNESLKGLRKLTELEVNLAGLDTFTTAFLADLRTDIEVWRGDWGQLPRPERGLRVRCRIGSPDLEPPSDPAAPASARLARRLGTRQLLRLREQVFGPDHEWSALARMGLALEQQMEDRLAEAGAEWDRAARSLADLAAGKGRDWREKRLLEACLADCRHHLALVRIRQGKADEAERLIGDGSHLKTFGSRWVLNRCLMAQALLALRKREALARLPWNQVIANAAGISHNASLLMPEQDQLRIAAWARVPVDLYLSFCAMSGKPQPVNPALGMSLSNGKASVLIEQSRLRSERRHPQMAPLFKELDELNRKVATLASAARESRGEDAPLRELQLLLDRREKLEVELARRRYRLPRMMNQAPWAQLPPRAVLVDFYEYDSYGAPPTKGSAARPRRLACLSARNAPRESTAALSKPELFLVDLGPAEPVAEAVKRWRSAIERGGDMGRGLVLRDLLSQEGGSPSPSAALRRRVWEPLLPFLKAARTVFVAPDGVLSFIPFAALPGSKPGTFLLEECAVVTVPVPHVIKPLLKNLGAPRDQRHKPPADEPPRMLLVGGVEYGKATRSGPAFAYLPGTAKEIRLIRQGFIRAVPKGEVIRLQGPEATKKAFRRESSRCRWIHLATHGFFLTNTGPFATAGSGLALAGANAPRSGTGAEGLLTAIELADLDLQGTELMVLSACETSLGEVRRGQGVRGLQAAMQLAGVRTTVTSLWKVHDEATQALMVELYRNLWERKLPKIEALRQAQLAMLRGTLYRPDLVGKTETAPSRVLTPYYWAAFVLSGDWR
jgi:CHAT domain-containing protein